MTPSKDIKTTSSHETRRSDSAPRPFRFLDYSYKDGEATFRYEGKNGAIFTEKVNFVTDPGIPAPDPETLDHALFLAFVLLGLSYYKAAPTREVELDYSLSPDQANFFNHVYQEGLSQFAFENHLTRDDLAHFSTQNSRVPTTASVVTTSTLDQRVPTTASVVTTSTLGQRVPTSTSEASGSLILVSGGKDSLLLATLAKDTPFVPAYVTTSDSYPEIIDAFGAPVLIRRHLDLEMLKKVGGLTGHIPISLIIESLALIQAILLGLDTIELGIGEEGIEPHAWIGDLPVNHQWAKTPEAQGLLRDYIKSHISENLHLGDRLSTLSELEIAEKFADLCWPEFGDRFSSCNNANYRVGAHNQSLAWCGKCPKCANSYLLFAPFVPFEEQQRLFGRDLFTDPDLTETFKGLLGVDGVMKPFECIASISELRTAYANRLPGYGALPFEVPAPD